MIVSEIMTHVKRTFGDESGVQATDADIIRWINVAQRQIVLQNETLHEKIGTASSVLNQMDYSFPSDLLILRSIAYKELNGITYMPLDFLDFAKFNEYIRDWDTAGNNVNGTPVIYSIYSNQFKLWPVPDTAVASGIKIFFNRTPVDVVLSSDTPDVPLIYHDSVVKLCLQQAYEMDEDWDASTVKAQQVDSELKLLRGREDWKSEEYYPSITVRIEDL